MKSVNTIISRVFLSAVFALSGTFVLAQPLTLQTDQNDLRANELRSAPDAPLANVRRETVSFTALVAADYSADTSASFVATSREYRTHVSADELQRGITLRTSGAGAVVSLSPMSHVKGAGLSPLDLSVQTPAGNVLRGTDAMDQRVDQRAIQATGIPFSNGMVGFRLNEALGHGEFVLRSQSRAPASHYQVHVLDVQGSAELTLGAPQQVLVGQAFTAEGDFSSDAREAVKSATAFLLRPDGERVAANVQVEGTRYAVTAKVDTATTFNEGLWELHVSTFDANGLQRDVKTAFAAAYPTARLDGSVVQIDTLSFELGVQTASEGRYEIGAVLYGMKEGQQVPIATSATAGWLTRGASQLMLSFDPSQLPSDVAAPFVLRHLTLKDQSRLAVLEHIGASSPF